MFGERETIRCGTSAPAAQRARAKVARIVRFISEFEVRPARKRHFGRAEAVFKIALVEQIVPFEVKADRAEFTQRMAIAQDRLRARWSTEPEGAAGHRSKIVRRSGISENCHQTRREPLRPEEGGLMPRHLVSLPHAGDQGSLLASVPVGVSTAELQRARRRDRRADLRAGPASAARGAR